MPLGYCKVRVNITALVKDGNDSDIAPDEQALSGQLKLVPMVKPGTPLQYDDGGRKKLKVLTALENIEIGPFGDIVNGAVDFVTVPAPDASNTNIASLQWQAIFVNPKYGNKIVQINDIFFYAVAGVDIDLAEQVNTAPSSTAVQITRGPRGFGVVDTQIEDDELVFYAGPLDDPEAWLEAGRVPAPTGGGVADGGVTTAKLAADAVTGVKIASEAVSRSKLSTALQNELDAKLSETEAAASYVPLFQPFTDYAAGALAVSPTTGQIGTAKTAFTSGASYNAANWTLATGGGTNLTKDSTTGMYVIGSGSTLTKDNATGMYPIGA